MAVIASGQVDLSSMVTHRYKLDDLEKAYHHVANQRDGEFEVAITPSLDSPTRKGSPADAGTTLGYAGRNKTSS
ncbi:hypothetical protein [uncultured Hyphomicrobium sp.]|jgi:hypothetical protein|uniref:hypothetical protein n=1 Tax=uncultured Hyphomicrobium sp. TaxID=194373 RepID=UPI0025DBCC01|nr:hypothetical protein [uncultured Hyphomicrobium sp.]